MAKKILFVRGVERYSPNAVLASKIATLVSSAHFSSERLLDNCLVGSRGIPGYAVSVADFSTREHRKKFIEKKRQIFPGSGIIDEVTNFVNETDPNIENFGFSSRDIPQSHLTKIDFDRCYVTSKISKENYEQNILTQPQSGIYHGASHVQTNPVYIKEKLFARLKLSMLPDALLGSLANKSFTPKDAQSRDRAVAECTNRSNIALELFFEHPKVSSFLSQNPSILNQCYQKIAKYISTHFADEEQELLQCALRARVELIQKKIENEIDIKFTLTDYVRPEIVEISSSAEQHQIVEQDADSSLETHHSATMVHKAQASAPEITKSESTFLSRNWLKLLGITVLAPLGVGVVGGVVGFGAGLVVGGAAFGARIVYDEQQYRAFKPVKDTYNGDEPRSSPSVRNLMQQVDNTSQQLDKGITGSENELVQIHKKSRVTIKENDHILSRNFEIK